VLNEHLDDREQYLSELTSGKYTHIIGADECALGSWAGPLFVCAVAVPIGWKPIAGLDDSKKVRPAKRNELYYFLKDRVDFSCVSADSKEIDQTGIGQALRRCFIHTVSAMSTKFPNSLIVLDGEVKLPGIDHLHFPKADGEVPAVMAASIIGKVLHDRQMVELGKLYPGYNFGKNSGYGTPDHQAALKAKGPSPIHRASYAPIQKLKMGATLTLEEEPGITLDCDTTVVSDV
jgi:ribonuclease HII